MLAHDLAAALDELGPLPSDARATVADKLAVLVGTYAREAALWRSAPKVGEVRARLDRAAKALTDAGEALGDLRPADLRLLQMDGAAAGVALDRLDGLAGSLRAAVQDLDERGARDGGARRLIGFFETPPRWRLISGLAGLLEGHGHKVSGTEGGLLFRVAAAALEAAGEADPERGLKDIVKKIAKDRAKNLAEIVPVRRLH